MKQLEQEPLLFLAAEDQDVNLHPVLEETLRDDTASSTHSMYCPTSTLFAIAQAGEILRADPATKLADSTFDIDNYSNTATADRILAKIINATVQKPDNVSGVPDLRCKSEKGLDVCRLAESKFLEEVRGLSSSKYHKRIGSVDIITQDDVPVILRKSNGVASGLTLANISIDGIPYPPGSIVRTVLKIPKYSGADSDDFTHTLRPKPGGVNVYPVSNIMSCGFLRLSAFALPTTECRQAKWVSRDRGFGYSARRVYLENNRVRRTSIDQISKRVAVATKR